jgi:hypothetical protein
MDLGALVEQLSERAGDLWFAAVVGAFFVVILESAKPNARKGERAAEPQGFALLVMIMSLITPLLLLIHAVATGSGAVIAGLILIGGIIIGGGLIGWIIGSVAPDVGRTLNRTAPFLAVAVFALAIYVTWRSAFALIDGFIISRFR